MKQLIKINNMLGRTVKAVVHNDDNIWIRFNDDSFIVLDTELRSHGFEAGTIRLDVDMLNNTEHTNKELMLLGFITKEQYQQALADEELENESRRLKYIAEQKFRDEKAEFDLYIKLKKKFSSGD